MDRGRHKPPETGAHRDYAREFAAGISVFLEYECSLLRKARRGTPLATIFRAMEAARHTI